MIAESTRAEPPAQPLGACRIADRRCRFLVWAPVAKTIELEILEPGYRRLPMRATGGGYYTATVEAIDPGTTYVYRLDGARRRPDPASRFQPDGVHGPSAVVDLRYPWTDSAWAGLPFNEYVLYELHVGTYTASGTFGGVIEHLDELRDLGVTAVQLMPVAQFPGARNWGYDGVLPYAAQHAYGGPDGLRALVNAAHQRGMAVVLDVVYNHLGPEGNYLAEFGPYFTDRYRTPWGAALNFDGAESDEVRRYFIENALFWIRDMHIDALRLDAVDSIHDRSARPFLAELAAAVRLEGERLGRAVHTIAESSLNDPRLVTPAGRGGLGIDAQWCDDLHHALQTELTGERGGPYADFRGFEDIVKAYQNGFVLDGRFSTHHRRRHGAPAPGVPPDRLVVYSQNHDQVGNRVQRERATTTLSLEQIKLAAATVILSPYTPMLFMGEEYGERAPFHYFTSYDTADLIEAVRQGRKRELAECGWPDDPADPQADETFERSKLNHSIKAEPAAQHLRAFYRCVLRLRATETPLTTGDRARMAVTRWAPARTMVVRRWSAEREVVTVFHFGPEPTSTTGDLAPGAWEKILDSREVRWGGPGARLPVRVISTGSVDFELSPNSVFAYARTHRASPPLLP